MLRFFQSGNRSIHNLTQRSTGCESPEKGACLSFNSRPHAEVDQFCNGKNRCFILSTHDLTQRSTHPQKAKRKRIITFNSRPHAEVDYPHQSEAGIHVSFNSRPHAEVDRCIGFLLRDELPFNSRPHAEVDFSATLLSGHRDLSTHDLTQRSTSFQVCWIPAIHLSTHDLTQRSTAILTTSCRRNALSTHDLTQRSTRRQAKRLPREIFQLTTSRRGRPDQNPALFVSCCLSTHDLTQRSTRCNC